MTTWRDDVPEKVLQTWDRLATAARTASAQDGLPDGLPLPEAVANVVAIAMARGILRPRPGGQPGELEATSLSSVPLHGLLAFLSGRVEAWVAAVREVDAAVVGAPGADGEGARPPRKGTLLKPLLTPEQVMVLVERVRNLEAGVRGGGHRREVFQPAGRVAGIAWIPDGSELPKGVEPENAAEWGAAGGAQGLYLPIRALPDVLTALAILSGDFFVASGRDGRGPAGSVGPVPGREDAWDGLDELRQGRPVAMTDVVALLERWAREAKDPI
jgi:hypothetical protein